MNWVHFKPEKTPLGTPSSVCGLLSCRRFAVWCLSTSISILAVVTVILPATAAVDPSTDKHQVRVVNMLAERFFFVPSRIKIAQGETLELRIRSADTNHGFRIRRTGVNVVVPKRGKGWVKVVFHAKEKGRYDFECSKPCGAGHNIMRGTIIVE